MNKLITGEELVKGIITDIRQGRLPLVGQPRQSRGAQIGEIHYWKDGNKYQKTIHGWVPVGHSGFGITHTEWGQHFHPEAWGQPVPQKEPTPAPEPEPVQELAPVAPVAKKPEPAPELSEKNTQQRLAEMAADIAAAAGVKTPPQKVASPVAPPTAPPKEKTPEPFIHPDIQDFIEEPEKPKSEAPTSKAQIVNLPGDFKQGYRVPSPAGEFTIAVPELIRNASVNNLFMGIRVIKDDGNYDWRKSAKDYFLIPAGKNIYDLASKAKTEGMEQKAAALLFIAKNFTKDGVLTRGDIEKYQVKPKFSLSYKRSDKKVMKNLGAPGGQDMGYVGEGINRAHQVQLPDGSKGLMKTSFESRHPLQFHLGTGKAGESGPKGFLRHGHMRGEMASFVLDRFLGLHVAPVAVFKQEGTATWKDSAGKTVKLHTPQRVILQWMDDPVDKNGNEISDGKLSLNRAQIMGIADQVEPLDMAGIAIMDMLGGNTDRHANNIMLLKKGKKYKAVCIDNADNFMPFRDKINTGSHGQAYEWVRRYGPVSIPSRIIERLKASTMDELDAHIGEYLSLADSYYSDLEKDSNYRRHTLRNLSQRCQHLASLLENNNGMMDNKVLEGMREFVRKQRSERNDW